ncbi:hypothetical protein [Clostridium sp. DL1XJH146]
MIEAKNRKQSKGKRKYKKRQKCCYKKGRKKNRHPEIEKEQFKDYENKTGDHI